MCPRTSNDLVPSGSIGVYETTLKRALPDEQFQPPLIALLGSHARRRDPFEIRVHLLDRSALRTESVICQA